MKIKWQSKKPEKCDICKSPLDKAVFFVDGKTVFGPWATMCQACHTQHGLGLGQGKGQMFELDTLELAKGA